MSQSPPKKLETDKAKNVHAMFSEVAQNYDRLNSIISLGIHHRWRKECVRWSEARPGHRVLDLATGTGDLALEFAKITGPTGEVLGTDFNAEMLKTAPSKAAHQGLKARFELADATALPYADSSFEVVSISFGIRNVDDPKKAIREMARVAKPGGRIMVLETGQATNPLFRAGFQIYFGTLMPRIARLLGGSQSAYGYLQKSSSEFPSGERFLELLRSAATFSEVAAKPLFGGVAWLYRGVVAK